MPLYDGYIEILLVIAVKATRRAKYDTFGVQTVCIRVASIVAHHDELLTQ